MAYTPSYVKKNFVNNNPPALNAANMNAIETAIENIENGLRDASDKADTNETNITALQNNPTFTGDAAATGDIIAGDNVSDGHGNTLADKLDASALVDILPHDRGTGDPTIITDGYPAPVLGLKATIEPIQNLHGYANPWPAGMGKNKLPVTVANLKALNTSGTWNGNAYTQNGVTFAVLTDSDGNVTGVKLSGTASAQTGLKMCNEILPAGSYVLSGTPTGGAYTKFWQVVNVDSVNYNDFGGGASVTNAGTGTMTAFIYVASGYVTQGETFAPMLRLSGTTATFEPYTNICNIAGISNLDVIRSGLNMFNPASYETFDLTGEGVYRYGHSFKSGTYTIVNTSAIAWYYRTPTADLTDRGTTTTISAGTTAAVTVDATHILWVFCQNWGSAEPNKIAVNPSDSEDFTAYTGENITVDLLATRYGADVDILTGALTDKMRVITPTVTSINYSSSAQSYYALCNVSGITLDTPALSNMYSREVSSDYPHEGSFRIFAGTIGIYDNRFTDAPTAQAILNDCRICYELATPTTASVDPETLDFIHGDNVLTTNGDSLTVDYLADVALYIAKLLSNNGNGNRNAKGGGESSEETPKEEKEEVKEDTKDELKPVLEPVTKGANK